MRQDQSQMEQHNRKTWTIPSMKVAIIRDITRNAIENGATLDSNPPSYFPVPVS